jgi:hypothetical protein
MHSTLVTQNGASTIKQSRRSRRAIESLKDQLFEVVQAEQPMTVRQVFYQMVSLGAVKKTETEYDKTVGRLLNEMRMDGDLPFEWIVDNTRWIRKTYRYSSLEQALDRTAELYERLLWDNQDVHVQIWLEKDALSGVIYQITDRWDVPLMVTKGYSSLSFLYNAAQMIEGQGKPTIIYYFGDHDPSGVHIPVHVEERLREFVPDAEITFERVAVNPDQISQWGLQTRPTKASDPRSKSFHGESVELDAIRPSALRNLVRDCIIRHIDKQKLNDVRMVEAEERKALRLLGRNVG